MADKYDIPPYVLSRVRYYDGEYLKDDEFIDEQKYHIDRKQRHDRLLHVAGVCEGLVPSVGDAKTVKVAAGTAIDDQGHTILIDTDASIAVKPADNGALNIVLTFAEREDRPADNNSAVASNTRFSQAPVLQLSAAAVAHGIVLGQALITSGTLSQVTMTNRVYSGLRMPGPGNAGYILHARGDAVPGLVDLECNLNITGTLQVTGNRFKNKSGLGMLETDKDDWLRVNPDSTYPAIALHNPVAVGTGGLAIGDWSKMPAGQLKVTNNAYVLGSLGVGTSSPKGAIHAVGDLVLGLDENNKKFIVHSRTNGAGEFLQITHDKADGSWEWADGITLQRSGNVGIDTTGPISILQVNGTLTAGTGGAAPGNIGNVQITGSPASPVSGRVIFGTDDTGWQLRFAKNKGGTITDIMTLHDNTGVAIGTTDPAGNKLRVAGTAQIDSTLKAVLGAVANGLNLGTSGTQTTYQYAYESLGTDNPNHNLRLFSSRQILSHAAQGFTFSKLLGGSGDASVEGTLSFGAAVRQMINLWNDSYGVGVQSSTLYFRTGTNVAFYKGGSHNDNALNPGGGTAMLTIANGDITTAGDTYIGGSGLYFTSTTHKHSGYGNTTGYAAIENATDYGALMILGRSGTPKGRYVRLWDYLQVNGGLETTGTLTIGDWRIEASGSGLYFRRGNDTIMRIGDDWDHIQIYKNLNGAAPYFYFNANGSYGVYNG